MAGAGGGGGWSVGVAVAVPTAPSPRLFTPRTSKAYSVPLVRPVTVTVRPVPTTSVQDAPARTVLPIEERY